MISSSTKVCTDCGKRKPLKGFYKNKRIKYHRTGSTLIPYPTYEYRPECISCTKRRRRARNLARNGRYVVPQTRSIPQIANASELPFSASDPIYPILQYC